MTILYRHRQADEYYVESYENDFLIPYRLRTVKVAVQATVLTVAGLIVYALLSGTRITYLSLFWFTLLAAALGVAFMGALPWKRLFQSKVGLRMMYLWSAMDIVLISVLVIAVGKDHSEMFFIYALTTVFFAAAAYPQSAQAALLVITFISYLLVQPFVPGGVGAPTILIRFVVLTGSALMASFLSAALRDQMEAHRMAHLETKRRTELLAIIARSARTMSSLDPDRVLGVVADSVVGLGFEASSLCVIDDLGETYSVVKSRGVPLEYAEAIYPASTGMVGVVLERRGIVRVDDYSSFEKALPLIKDLGFKSVIAAPIWIDKRIEAVLIGGSRQKVDIDAAGVEAFDLLSSQAARAIENAKRFADAKKMVDRLAELDRLKNDFLSNMSHELRTPLTAIEGMTVTMLERWENLDEESRLNLLKRVNANSESLDEIITNLLDFARFDSGQIELKRIEFDMERLLNRVAERLQHMLREHPFRLISEGPLVIEADPTLMERVVENFLSNAAKHTDPGTEISLSARVLNDRLIVSVSDNGPGIPPEELPHIGDRFFRGGDTNTRATRGVGLGLAFAKQIIDLHEGTFEVDSKTDEGTTFRFTLPLAEPHPRDESELRASV